MEEIEDIKRDFSHLKDKDENGKVKELKIVCIHYFYDSVNESDEKELYYEVDVIGYFNSMGEIKEYLNNPIERKEIRDSYGEDEIKLEVVRITSPYDEDSVYKLKEKFIDTCEDGMLFCPYCGKYRYFEELDYDTTCEICGVSIKNYDVQLYN